MISGSFLFTSTSSTISVCTLLVYIRESPIWKGEVGDLVWFYSLQTLFDVMNTGLSNFCKAASLIASSSVFALKFIGFPVIGSSFVHMEAKAKLNMEYLGIDSNLLQNPANFIKLYCIYNSGRNYSEWFIVSLYLPKYRVKTKYLPFVNTHFPSS